MASLDFEREKRNFRIFYDENWSLMEDAKNSFIHVINSLIKNSDVGEVTKIEGRVKDREECIKKFQRKYQANLEAGEQPYEIKDYLSDLIGVRIVCLYEDQIGLVSEALKSHFKIIDVSDKIAAMESTEDLFGYKGLHMDVALKVEKAFSKSQAFFDKPFEIQIRSLIQDAWSVLDHKIKYKKSIPNDLKRRINVLSALFELADREFKEIRNATMELIQQAKVAPISDVLEESNETTGQTSADGSGKTVNAFNFLRVAGHFFKDFVFDDKKVDNFVQDILKLNNDFKKADLHRSLIENLTAIREYRDNYMAANPESTFSPYTSIRHCLYLYDKKTYGRILSKGSLNRFEGWLQRFGANHP